eukprot:SAG22_NODE_799_length_7128_cov_14.224356_3_plen_80_part_00
MSKYISIVNVSRACCPRYGARGGSNMGSEGSFSVICNVNPCGSRLPRIEACQAGIVPNWRLTAVSGVVVWTAGHRPEII